MWYLYRVFSNFSWLSTEKLTRARLSFRYLQSFLGRHPLHLISWNAKIDFFHCIFSFYFALRDITVGLLFSNIGMAKVALANRHKGRNNILLFFLLLQAIDTADRDYNIIIIWLLWLWLSLPLLLSLSSSSSLYLSSESMSECGNIWQAGDILGSGRPGEMNVATSFEYKVAHALV